MARVDAEDQSHQDLTLNTEEIIKYGILFISSRVTVRDGYRLG